MCFGSFVGRKQTGGGIVMKRLRAVGLILVNPADKILVLQEFVAKPGLGKHGGMFSIPMETCHVEEANLLTLKRLYDEELTGIPFLGKVTYIGAYRIAPRVWVRLYSMRLEKDSPEICGYTQEVGNHKWVSINEALTLWLRRGAVEMIEDYAEKRHSVLRITCRDVTASPQT